MLAARFVVQSIFWIARIVRSLPEVRRLGDFRSLVCLSAFEKVIGDIPNYGNGNSVACKVISLIIVLRQLLIFRQAHASELSAA